MEERQMKNWKMPIVFGVAILGLAAVAAGQTKKAAAAKPVSMNASGASFPEFIYKRWFSDYKNSHPGIEINYQGGGSGQGIKDLTAGSVDFAASDRPLTDAEFAAARQPLYFPTVLGAVVVAYNLPSVKQPLKMTPEVVAGIFLLKIAKWNDPRIAEINKGVTLPGDDITVVHRTDGSGTTFVFTEYLAKVSPEWKAGPGTGQTVKWPGGLGQAQNPGVAGAIKQTPGAVGYVEMTYVLDPKSRGNMEMASIKNSSGEFVTASVASATLAGSAAADFPTSITNSPIKGAYPISTFTYLLIPSKIADPDKKAALAGFLKWMLVEGQKTAPELFYAPLPKPVLAKDQKQLAQLQ
jgi:phosphate transport system substrate-binding protein